MGIWLELGIFGLVFVFCFWQLHDVKKAKEKTRLERQAREARNASQPPPAGPASS